jgi:hypothetical protein
MYKTKRRKQVMKKIFTLAALFISMISFAAAPPRAGKMIINNADRNDIVVRINGRSYNVDQQALILNSLTAGRIQLEVYKTEKKPYAFGRSKPVLIFSSAVYVDPSFIVDVNVNRFGKVSIGKSMNRNSNDRSGYGNDNRYNDDRFGDSRGRDDRYEDNKYDGKNYDDNKYGDKNYADKSRDQNNKDNNKGNRPGRY